MKNNRESDFRIHCLVSVLLWTLAIFSIPAAAASPREKALALPEKNFTNFKLDTNTSLMQRVSDAPSFVIKYLREMDSKTNYRPYVLLPSERVMLSNYLTMLPPIYARIFKQRLIGIYFVDHFLGSGMADWVIDSSGRVTTILMINPATMKNDISKWLTLKENTCFLPDKRIYVRVSCGTNYTGLLYILLHEGAHITDYVLGFTPYVEKGLKDVLMQSDKPTKFTARVWKEYSMPIKKYDYPFRKKADFYGFSGGPFISVTNALKIYKAMEKTPFCSIYGSKMWAEDFAEAVTFYHLTIKMGLPYEIEVYRDGMQVGSFHFAPERLGRKGYFKIMYQ